MKKYNFTAEQRSLLESLQQPFAVYQYIDKRVVSLILSDGFLDLFGYTDRALAHHEMDNEMYWGVHPDDTARIADAALRFAQEGGVYDSIYRTRTKNSSEYRIIHAQGKHVLTETGEQIAQVWYTDEGVYSEKTDQDSVFRQAMSDALHEESILKASHYDSLTGLPNMAHFFDLASVAKEQIVKKGGKPVLLYLNLSGMKYYNHRHGFAEGDKLLLAFTKVLVHIFGHEACCHAGADHFIAYTTEDGLEDQLQMLFTECKQMNDGNSLPVLIGIYKNSMEDVTVSSACDRAKLACDELKDTHSSAYKYYEKEMSLAAVRRQYILENYDKAIKEKWIRVYYQPIARAVNGSVSDEEALSRWIDPVSGFLSPGEFIPILEDAGIIYKLDLYVVEQVLEKIKMQKEAGLFVVPHSINLSRSDFDACDIVEEIRKRVDDAGISRNLITIEITESVIGNDFDFIKEQIERFQKLGFPVWMDDFGSGYSSLDVLQRIKFDLIKFDMAFMRNFDKGVNGKIILTELMKMAAALDVDTVCEGVETSEQVRFLLEIGCSKLQGFYYTPPIPFEKIIERYQNGTQIGFENPEESEYYESIGRVNLYDLAVLTNEEGYSFHNFFNTLPMAIIEFRDNKARFIRTNQSYRDFLKRFFSYELDEKASEYTDTPSGSASSFINILKQCCSTGNRAFFDESMPDGSIVHFFARRIGVNPVSGTAAAAISVLSITDANEGATYASIARALAADYYNIYYVDLDTERFIEYTSPVGGEELAMERHGENFFASAIRDTMTRIYEDDREYFTTIFTKENIIHELDEQGVFTTTYRLVDTGKPLYANMKITRMQPGSNHIILGVSIIDAQMKQKEQIESIRKERDTLARVMALAENYLSLYTINPETGYYHEYSTSDVYDSLGLDREGKDFFEDARINGEKSIYHEDLQEYYRVFTKENIMKDIRETGVFKMHYRLVLHGEPRPVSLRIAPVKESDGVKLVAGVRAWIIRK